MPVKRLGSKRFLPPFFPRKKGGRRKGEKVTQPHPRIRIFTPESGYSPQNPNIRPGNHHPCQSKQTKSPPINHSPGNLPNQPIQRNRPATHQQFTGPPIHLPLIGIPPRHQINPLHHPIHPPPQPRNIPQVLFERDQVGLGDHRAFIGPHLLSDSPRRPPRPAPGPERQADADAGSSRATAAAAPPNR